MKRWWIILLLLPRALAWATPQDEQESLSFPIEISTRVSKTALYVGDVLEYRVSLLHPKGISFVTEELEDRLGLRPFELLEFRLDRKDLGEAMLLEMVLKLVCYELPGVLQIPSFTLFYYPTESLSQEDTQQEVPATALVVPPYRLRVQTTLLGQGDHLRDWVVLESFPRSSLILPASSAVILLGIVAYLIFLGVRLVIESRKEQETSEEQLREASLDSLRTLQAQGASSGEEPALYLEVSKVLRHFLHSRYGFFSPALSPEEIRDHLQRSTSDPEFSAKVESLLETCDRLFFGRESQSDSNLSDLCAQAVSLVRSTALEANESN